MKKFLFCLLFLFFGLCLLLDSVAETSQQEPNVLNLDGIQLSDRENKNNPKLQSVLGDLLRAYKKEGLKGAINFSNSQNIRLKDGRVRLVLEAGPGKFNTVAKKVEALGCQVETAYKELIQVLVPISAIDALSRIQGLNYIRRPYLFKPDIISEGVSLIGADIWQGQGYNGQGTKVAIVDLGFQGYEDLLGTELPDSVVARSFRADGDITGGGEVHGTACAEIVHDVAPSAQFYLINFSTDVELGNVVDYLINEGVDVVSHSIGWFNTGPGEGTGIICQVVDKAKEAGILWVNAAGNSATMHWEGSFVDILGSGWHEFEPGISEGNPILTLEGLPIVVTLRWDDWWDSDQDYDLYLFDDSGENVLAGSTNLQTGSQTPTEELTYIAPYTGLYFIAIKKENATRDVYFELYTFYQELWYGVPESSLSQPADSPNALAVGATYWADDSLEYFSSQGPTDGDNPQIKPDLTAPDGVSTSTYGAGLFHGTSASCPHVAGAAALLKSWNPTLGPDQIKCFLESWAIDLGDTGKDNLYGSGRLDLGTGPPGDPCEGDFDFDGDVDGTDLAIFAVDFGRTDCCELSVPPCEGDFDGDCDVDGSDLAVFAADFGRTDCPICE